MALRDAKKRMLGDKYDTEELIYEGYDYSVWSENRESIDREESTDNDEESTDKEELTDIQPMPPQEGDEEEVTEGKGLQFYLQTNN